jgi:hypothetical protein
MRTSGVTLMTLLNVVEKVTKLRPFPSGSKRAIAKGIW